MPATPMRYRLFNKETSRRAHTYMLCRTSIRQHIAEHDRAVVKRRKKFKSFKFLDEFIPESKKYLSKEHLEHLMGMTEVEAPIPPQLPKQMKQKLIEPDIPEHIEYAQIFPEFSILSSSQPRFVELHLHLEGTMTMDTLWELYQQKKRKNILTDSLSFDNVYDLLAYIQMPLSCHTNDSDLFYDKHRYLCEIIRGDYEAIERVAYELCQRQYKNKVYYTEVRFNPYLLCNSFDTTLNSAVALNEFDEIVPADHNINHTQLDTELRLVIEAVINGLNRGCREYHIQINPIVSCLRYRPDLSYKLIDLAFEYRDLRNNRCHIVGLDLFGGNELRYHSRLHFNVFKKCKALGLNRTAHCGDSFNLKGLGLLNTIHTLNPERIAYCIAAKMPKHILHRIFERQVHLELTPKSNLFQFPHIYEQRKSEVVAGNDGEDGEDDEYDMAQFMQWLCNNSANFSISTDFPILLDNKGDLTYLNELNRCMLQYNIGDWEIAQSVLNAARASFLNDHDKNMLLMILRDRWKSVAPNLDETNFISNFQDTTWNNHDLLRLDLLRAE